MEGKMTEYEALIHKLIDAYRPLQEMSFNDMGCLSLRMANKFHRIETNLKNLIVELSEDAEWPHEPFDPYA